MLSLSLPLKTDSQMTTGPRYTGRPEFLPLVMKTSSPLPHRTASSGPRIRRALSCALQSTPGRPSRASALRPRWPFSTSRCGSRASAPPAVRRACLSLWGYCVPRKLVFLIISFLTCPSPSLLPRPSCPTPPLRHAFVFNSPLLRRPRALVHQPPPTSPARYCCRQVSVVARPRAAGPAPSLPAGPRLRPLALAVCCRYCRTCRPCRKDFPLSIGG